jgi:hypothetical protein
MHATTKQVLLAAVLGLSAVAAHASDVTFTFTNLAPAGGVGVAPLWLGLHDGNFDTFNAGAAASTAIERAAEDGNPAALVAAFASQAPSGVQTVLPGGPRFPGTTSTFTLHNVDLSGANRYLNYAAMVVLSSDYFIGNDSPTQLDLSGLAGGGKLSLSLGGAGHVWDAGTEVNDFATSVANAAFGIGGGQSQANQGADEGGVVHVVTGDPYAGFLGAAAYVPPGFDWTPLNFNSNPAFGRLDIEVSAVPEPSTYAMLLGGLALVGLARRRKA